MERLAKYSRNICGLLLVANIIITIFVPITERVQENYDTISCTQFGYISSMFWGKMPQNMGNEGSGITAAQVMIIIFLMLLPALSAAAGGIYGIAGSPRQIFTSIAAYAVFAMYIALFMAISVMWPESENGEAYQRGIACLSHLLLTGAAAIAGTVALISTPKKRKVPAMDIEGMHIFTDSNMEDPPRYNVLQQPSKNDTGSDMGEIINQKTQPVIPEYVAGTARGVMVGLKGMYAGAEIPFKHGETIRLGRLPENDLVFPEQGRVSRNHCSIRWDKEGACYYFKDYSSNGSFIEGMNDCIPQNIEMRMSPGTVVFIGSEDNAFRLE